MRLHVDRLAGCQVIVTLAILTALILPALAKSGDNSRRGMI
jgi:hypothetical protein